MPRLWLAKDDWGQIQGDLFMRDVRRMEADQFEQEAHVLVAAAPPPEQTIPEALLRVGTGLEPRQTPQDVPQPTLTETQPEPLDIARSTSPARPRATFNPDLLDLTKPAPIAPTEPLPTPKRTASLPPLGTSDRQPLPTRDLVAYARQTAQRAGIDPDQFLRQINQESGFQPFNADGTPKRSSAGALGIAQIMPNFHPSVDPTDPYASLTYAARLMANLKRQYGTDELALVAYNGGQGAVNAWLAGEPYAESSQYVSRILGGKGGIPAQDPLKGDVFSQLLAAGKRELGKRYAGPVIGQADAMRWGTPGWDCSSFVSGIFSQVGVRLTPYTDAIARETKPVAPGDMKPGDIFLTYGYDDGQASYYKHAGLYIGEGQVLDASYGRGVSIHKLSDLPGKVTFRRAADGGQEVVDAGLSTAIDPKAGIWDWMGDVNTRISQTSRGFFENLGVRNPLEPSTDVLPAHTPGEGFDPGHMRPSLAPEPGVPLRQDVRDLGLEPQATIFDQAGRAASDFTTTLGESLLSQGEQDRQALATANEARREYFPNITDPNHPISVLADLREKHGYDPMDRTGGRLRDRMTPEDRERYDNALLAVAGMTGPVGGGKLPKVTPETTPPTVTGPAVVRATGSAAEQAAVGAPDAGRAANILLEKFPEDVRPHLEAVANTFGQFAGRRRGVVPDVEAEANAAALALGTTPEQWIKTKPGRAFSQEEAIALGNTLAQVGKEYDDLLRDVGTLRATGMATPEKEAQLAEKTLEFAALASVRSGAAAEAGRALRAFRQTLEGGDYANRNKAIDAAFKAIGGDREKFAQWVEQFSTIPATDPVARYQMLQGLQQASWWDRISLLRYASMLSSTTTHMVNAFGNVVNVGLDLGLKPVSVGLDVARARMTGGERTRFLGEFTPQMRGLLDGAVTGLDKAAQTLKTGISPQDLGKFESVRPGFQSGNAAIDAVAEMPLRLLGAADSIFRGAAYGGQVRAIAARQGIKQGLTGQALRAFIDEVVANPVQHPKIVEEAMTNAARAVLQEPNRIASAFTSIGRGPGAQNTALRIVREIVVPFAKTPLNIMGQGLELTPAGLLKVRDLAKAGDVGGATDVAARTLAGSALMVGTGALAANGLVTGGYPANPRERDTLPTGWQPWSLRLPDGEGGHTYISFSQLGPLAIPLAIGAVAGQSLREGIVADPVTLASSLGRFMIDQTFLQGLSAIVDAIKDPKRYGENFTEQMATSFVPYAALAREVTRILGQADRDPKGAVQAIQALIPGVAENVPRRQDALGRDIHSTQTGVGAALSPMRYSTDQPEPVLQAFRDVGLGLPSAPKEIRVRSQVTGNSSPPMALTEREQDDYQRIFGQRLQERLLPIINSASWMTRSADARKKTLEQQLQAARDYAESQVYGKLDPADRQRRMQEGRARQQVKPLPAP